MKRVIQAGLLSVAVLLGVYLWSPMQDSTPKAVCEIKREKMALGSLGPQARSRFSEDGSSVSAKSPLELAEAYVKANQHRWSVAEYHDLKGIESKNPLGSLVVFQVYQGKYLVTGMRVRLRVDRFGQVEELENNYQPIPKVEDSEALSPTEAAQAQRNRYAVGDTTSDTVSTVLYYRENLKEAELAYVVSAKDKLADRQTRLVLRASDGQVLGRTIAHQEYRIHSALEH